MRIAIEIHCHKAGAGVLQIAVDSTRSVLRLDRDRPLSEMVERIDAEAMRHARSHDALVVANVRVSTRTAIGKAIRAHYGECRRCFGFCKA